MALKVNPSDVSAFKLLLSIAVMYGFISFLVYSVLHSKHIKPLDLHAPLDRFSEARAIEHVRVLSQEIDGRQEGRSGLREAARYIKSQLEFIKRRARDNIRVEIEENLVDGSFNMVILGHNMSFGYRDHTNLLARISSIHSQDSDPSVLINGHYDSPLNSPGASDCGSCVASMLELARLLVDSSWIPPTPVIFLFNGAEELFLLGSHGFMKSHKWRDTIGAFINVEASGTGSPDLVCQSGPGSWASDVYALSAVHPMANSAAQDIFPVIPGDTDFRIFAQDNGDIPGLDIIFMLGGYFYHTSHDTVDRLVPGSIQARGENLWSVMKAFASSPKIRVANERGFSAFFDSSWNERAVFFDYLTWFMVFYQRRTAVVLHSIPAVMFFIMPFLLSIRCFSLSYWVAILWDFTKGMLLHALGVVLGVLVPVIFAILRLLFSSQSMCWFAHPYLAFLMFIPCSFVGLLLPKAMWRHFPLSQKISTLKTSQEAASSEAIFWGAFGFYALLTLGCLMAGLGGGFLYFVLSASMLLAWISFSISIKVSHPQSVRPILCYVIPLIPCLVYAAYFGGFLVQFLIEKMGMMGSVPPPYGFFVPDVIVAAAVGLTAGWCMGPMLPVCQNILARLSIMRTLVHLTIVVMALSSRSFPYSVDAPKRVLFQHTYITADSNSIVKSSYDFSVVDSNSLSFLFKHAPKVANELSFDSELSMGAHHHSRRDMWLALFPVSFLLSESMQFSATSDEIEGEYKYFPYLSSYKPQVNYPGGSRRIHLELNFSSPHEVWVAVLNITGPVSNWSFADNIIPAPETIDGGPPSYICRLSGNCGENWKFWVEASDERTLRVKIAVLDQYIASSSKKLKEMFPEWVDVVAYSSFMSTYFF